MKKLISTFFLLFLMCCGETPSLKTVTPYSIQGDLKASYDDLDEAMSFLVNHSVHGTASNEDVFDVRNKISAALDKEPGPGALRADVFVWEGPRAQSAHLSEVRRIEVFARTKVSGDRWPKRPAFPRVQFTGVAGEVTKFGGGLGSYKDEGRI